MPSFNAIMIFGCGMGAAAVLMIIGAYIYAAIIQPVRQKRDERKEQTKVGNQDSMVKDFEGNQFAVQIIARGSYIDSGVGNGKIYAVEALTLRLNHIAYNEWSRSEMQSSLNSFSTEKDYQAHKAEYDNRRAAFTKKLCKEIGIDLNKDGIRLTQAQAEVFTVVQIWPVAWETGE